MSAADAEKLYIGLGRGAGIRPGDLVGAIANEAGIPSREIGAIEITDRFSLVEVPAAKIDAIIRAMKNTAIRGKKPKSAATAGANATGRPVPGGASYPQTHWRS